MRAKEERSDNRPWLVLMMKAPEPGKVKTRLGAEIGVRRAAELYRRFVEYLVEKILSDSSRTWLPVVAYTPAAAEVTVREWLAPILPAETLFVPQREGDLGEKLRGVFAWGFDAGASSVLAIGADCLDITPADITACFEALHSAPLAMGESLDGGYWVIGMSDRHFEIFEHMPWSTPELARATRDRADSLDLAIAEQGRNFDIDTRADLKRLAPAIRDAVGIEEGEA